MSTTTQSANPTPTLTLTPVLDAAPAAPVIQEVAAITAQPPSALDDSMLSEEEKGMVEAFSQQIDLRDSVAVMQYGAGAQKKMADFSSSALSLIHI